MYKLVGFTNIDDISKGIILFCLFVLFTVLNVNKMCSGANTGSGANLSKYSRPVDGSGLGRMKHEPAHEECLRLSPTVGRLTDEPACRPSNIRLRALPDDISGGADARGLVLRIFG